MPQLPVWTGHAGHQLDVPQSGKLGVRRTDADFICFNAGHGIAHYVRRYIGDGADRLGRGALIEGAELQLRLVAFAT